MRLMHTLWASLFLLAWLTAPALAVGLYVEQSENPETVFCPVCHKPIMPGSIHQNAEAIMATEFGGALAERGIPYTTEKGQSTYLHVFVYRFQERQGSRFSVSRPASVGFHVHLFKDGSLVNVFVFDETQQPLSDNIFRFFTFVKRGAKWVDAGDLAREGIHKAIDAFASSLKTEEEGK